MERWVTGSRAGAGRPDRGVAARAMYGLVVAAAAVAASGAGARADEPAFTEDFRIEDCRFRTEGVNPYFILEPGRQLYLEGEDDGESKQLFITVLRETKRIRLDVGGRRRTIETRVIEEVEYTDGELVEVSRNFYALCAKTHDVYYFGEEVDIYEDGEVVSHDGAWLAGRDGARPGIIMPGTFLLGSRYFQEIAPGVALDRAEHTRMGLPFDTPFGLLTRCVEVIETTPLEPGSQSVKVYAPGIGLVSDGELRLAAVIDDVDEDDEDGDSCDD